MMSIKLTQFVANTLLALLVASTLAACGDSSDSAQKAAQATQAKKAVVKQAQPDDPLVHMSLATTASKGALPLDLHFEITAPPEPGKAVAIKLAFVPNSDLLGLHAVIKTLTGLQLSADAQAMFDAPKAGEVKEFSFNVTPASTGIFLTNVEVTVTRDTGDTTYVYAIPLAVAAATIAPTVASSASVASKG